MRFAKRFDNVTGSAIRDIFKLLGQPGIISFAGGNPAEAVLEDALIADIARDVLLRDGKRILQYGATEGWHALLSEAARFLRDEIGVEATSANLLPTTGSTQAIDLLLKALIDPGDVILVEDPSFLGSLQAMRLYGARLVPVPMDENGILPDALEDAAKRYLPRMLYTVPTFQNPSGVTLPEDRRRAIVDLAERYDFLIAEDDPYRGLRYRGKARKALYSMDKNGRTIYLTSFSKLISPGLRVGVAVTPDPDLLRRLVVGKQSTDVHSANLSQAIVAEYLERGLLTPHVTGVCGRYRRQLDAMLGAMPEGVTVNPPQGGLFVWGTLPEGVDATRLLKESVARGVAFVPGTYFYANGGHLNTLRLNFSNSEPDAILEGMRRLGECIKEAM